MQCNLCPVSDECSIHDKWLREGKEDVQRMNSTSYVAEFDDNAIPVWFGECPLVKFVK